MADQAYLNALAEKERLLKELEKINNFLKLYQKYTSKGEPKAIPEKTLAKAVHYPNASKVSVPEKFAPIIGRTLLLAGRPLSRSGLLETLKSDGNPIPGENPGKNLGTILWRLKEQFVNLPGFGYWVAGVSLPQFGYLPEDGKSLEAARKEAEYSNNMW